MANGGDDGCEDNTRQLHFLITLRQFFSSHLQDDCALQRIEHESTHRLCDFAHHRTAI
ncbi:hypothetical protein BYT27DRAFT_7184755 [Phlegmacium glaucopus]|nr:hypothetical protein BYT27DRAFT_7184755 [Phlegmacium glaucopus]